MVGLEEVTTVEPISNFVLVVDENRQVATALTLTGQLAKCCRLGGSPLDVARATPGVRATTRDMPTTGSAASSPIAREEGLFRLPDMDR